MIRNKYTEYTMEAQQIQSNEKSAKTKSIVKWALILSIVIVLNLFFNYTISLIYKTPQFENFCPVELTSRAYTEKNSCVDVGGGWNETTVPMEVKSASAPTLTTQQISGYCDVTYSCSKVYNSAQSVYNRNVFIVLVILGIASLSVGVFVTGISVVSLGLSFGGVISLLIGSIRYWSDMDDWLRVAVLGVALVALIWLGVKKIRD